MRTLNIPNDASYDNLKQSLDRYNYFGVRRNLIIEQAKFNRRVQQQGESVDVFIQDLYRLVEHCEYGELREQLLRDRIVVGVIDDALAVRPATGTGRPDPRSVGADQSTSGGS